MIKYAYYILAIVIAGLVMLIMFFKIFVVSEVDSKCKAMEMIASDEDKIGHIKSRITNSYSASELLGGLGKAKYISKNFNPTLFDKINIDWEYIGLPEYFVKIHFDGVLPENKGFKRIRIASARNYIFINLSDEFDETTDQDLLLYNKNKAKKIKINNQVQLLCLQ